MQLIQWMLNISASLKGVVLCERPDSGVKGALYNNNFTYKKVLAIHKCP